MVRSRSKAKITCPYCNTDNSTIKKGKNVSGNQRYYCGICSKTFVETIHTIYYHKNHMKEKLTIISRSLINGMSLREIAYENKIDKNTISKLTNDMIKYPYDTTVFSIKDLEMNNVQCIKFWQLLTKRKKFIDNKDRIKIDSIINDWDKLNKIRRRRKNAG